MTTFKMNVDSVKRVISLGNQSKELSSITKPVFILENGKLRINLYSEKNIMTYESDIVDYVKDASVTGDDYFALSLNEFTSTLDKISNLENDVGVSIDRENKKVTIKNVTTGAKISLASDASIYTEEEVKEAKEAFATKKNEMFASGTTSISVTSELISSFDVAQKFITIQEKSADTLAPNSVMLKKDVMKYQDVMVLFSTKLATPATDSEEDVYLQRNIVDFVRPFAKKNGINVVFNSAKNAVLIESADFGFNSIVSLNPVRFEFPSDEEVEMFAPEASNEIKVSVNKESLMNTLKIFNGTFKAENWSLSEIDVDASKTYTDAGKLHFEHSDYTAECFNDVEVKVLNNTSPDAEVKFKISQDALLSVLNLTTEDTVTLSFNNIALDKPHGPGLKIETPTTLALCSKLIKA